MKTYFYKQNQHFHLITLKHLFIIGMYMLLSSY